MCLRTATTAFLVILLVELNFSSASVIGGRNLTELSPPEAIEISFPIIDKINSERDKHVTVSITHGNLTGKKAQPQSITGSGSSLRVFGIRDAVRVFLSSEAAPVIRKILTNLDRDLFKLFTPTGPPVPPATTELPPSTTTTTTTLPPTTEEPTTAPTPKVKSVAPTTPQEALTSTPQDEEEQATTPEINSSGSEEQSTISISTSDSDTYRANQPKPNINLPGSEDDEDESYLQNKLNQIY